MITSDLPMVAWSAVVVVLVVAGRGTGVGSFELMTGALGGVDIVGRSGSPGRAGV